MTYNKLGPTPRRLDVYVTKGTNWDKIIRIPDEEGGYIDLATFTFVGKIRKTYSSEDYYEFAFTPLDDKHVKWSLPTAVSDAMLAGCNDQDPVSRYVYDVLLTTPTGATHCIIKGLLTLNPRASR